MILREPWEYVSGAAAMRLGVPNAQVAFGLARPLWEEIGVHAPELNGLREGLVDELRWSPFLTRLPASLDASPFPATRRYRDPAAVPGDALPSWWADSGAPLLYVSFGTVLGRMPSFGEVCRAVIDAVAGFDARVLVTVGHDFDVSLLPDVPANVHVEAWVDQANVLGEAGLMVCHGGSGTVYGALAEGVPLVILPMFADQFDNARAVVTVGAGVVLVAPGAGGGRLKRHVTQVDVPRIRRAIETVLGGRSYGQAAQALAAEMATAPTIETLLEQLVQPRTSLSPGRP
ncbi:MAG: glycosyltransferase [Trebonia sp.]